MRTPPSQIRCKRSIAPALLDENSLSAGGESVFLVLRLVYVLQKFADRIDVSARALAVQTSVLEQGEDMVVTAEWLEVREHRRSICRILVTCRPCGLTRPPPDNQILCDIVRCKALSECLDRFAIHSAIRSSTVRHDVSLSSDSDRIRVSARTHLRLRI